jgi:hypothetical protein
MSGPIWPLELPQRPLGGLRIMPQNNRVSFEPDVGPTIDRRRASTSNTMFSAEFDLTSFYQKQVFEEWYRDTLLDGTLPFWWEDPTDCVEYEWKFYGKEAPYEMTANRGFHISLTVRLMRL